MKKRGKNGPSIGSVVQKCRAFTTSQGGNDELRKSEEAMPRLAERQLEKAATCYKTQTGLGCDGFHQGHHGLVKRNKKKDGGIPRLCRLGRRTSMFPEGFCGCYVRTLSMRDECSLKGVLRTIAGILLGVELELPTASICATGRLQRGAEGLPTAKVEGLCGRHHGRHGRQNEELAGIAEKVIKSIKKMEIEKKGLTL